MMEILGEGGPSAPAWTFFGVLVAGVFSILVEQIRARRRAEDVASTSTQTLDTSHVTNEIVKDLAREIIELKQQHTEHIRWHLDNNRRW